MSFKPAPLVIVIAALIAGAIGLFALQRVVGAIRDNHGAITATDKTASKAAKKTAEIQRILVEKKIIVQGKRGLRGGKGPKGSTGKTGPRGPRGRKGATGATGAAGADGRAGVDGVAGATGAAGHDGVNGTNGTDGATGPAGPQGPKGDTGATPTNLTCGQSDPDNPAIFTCVATPEP